MVKVVECRGEWVRGPWLNVEMSGWRPVVECRGEWVEASGSTG